MANRAPLSIDEWYHCYNRGTEKRTVFEEPRDYERFIALLYTSNGTKPVRISDRRDTRLHSILSDKLINRGDSIVEIGAYALMPNHIHILVRQLKKNGIAHFMQKVFTGYTMYFNLKYKRTGGLFSGTFKSKHILDDRYLKKVTAYILLNPVELFELQWKKGGGNIKTIEKKLINYPYSSLPDFFNSSRPEKKISGTDWSMYYDTKPRLSRMLADAQEYYQTLRPEV